MFLQNLILCGIAMLQPLYSQQVTGSILGTSWTLRAPRWRIPSGSSQPGTGLSVPPDETNAASTVSNLFLLAITRSKSARPGFRTFRQTGIALQVGQFARVDVRLEIGEAHATSRRSRRPAGQYHGRYGGQTVTANRSPRYRWSTAPSIPCST